ncbi:hypothetical protein DO70_5144 [Burkholderia pseudomallei]|nr:hypothetical protein DO70_5144 [Burkholderia pseudomallei]
MRASSAASTRVARPAAAPAFRRAASAHARSVPTGTTGSARPNASPCATPVAVRSPVNEPGPAPNAIALQSANARPASSSTSRTAGSTRVLDTAPVRSWRTQVRKEAASAVGPSAASSATEQNSVDVSMARSTVCVMADIVMRRPARTGDRLRFARVRRARIGLEGTLDPPPAPAC